eukprot:13389367-Alexandrium_andersonii.AAC.1
MDPGAGAAAARMTRVRSGSTIAVPPGAVSHPMRLRASTRRSSGPRQRRRTCGGTQSVTAATFATMPGAAFSHTRGAVAAQAES